MVEPNMELPVLPFNFVAVQFEADSLRLSDFERFDIRSKGPIFPSIMK